MYLYFYAPHLRARQYQSQLGLIEGRVTDFGIAGKVVQLSQFLKLSAAIREYGRRATTVVLVGDDELLEEAVTHFANTNVVAGFIPMGKSPLAEALGLPRAAAAADTLAARRIAKLDLASVGGQHFLGSAATSGSRFEIHCPTFSIFPKGVADLRVTNLGVETDPEDGLLNVRLTPIEGRFRRMPGTPTVFTTPSLRLKSAKPLIMSFGADQRLKLPLQIDSAPKAIRMIVGRRINSKGRRGSALKHAR